MIEEPDHVIDGEPVSYEVRVRLSPYESELIDEIAERSQISLGDVLRRALRAYAETEPRRRASMDTSAVFRELRRYLDEPYESNDPGAIPA